MPNAGQVIGELKAINKKLRRRNAELLAIVRELGGVENVILQDGEPFWCRVCNGPLDPHDPDCLWLRAQKFREDK